MQDSNHRGNMKKVCILGSTGLVGKTLVENLSKSYELHTPTRATLDLMDTSAVLAYFDQNRFDVVINCAADTRTQMVVSPEVLCNNVGIFTNLFAARNSYKRLINFGSGAEFDRVTTIHNTKEEELFLNFPTDIYGMSKSVCSRIACNTENMYTLRLFGVFGPNDPPRRLLKLVESGEPLSLDDKYFDYYYVNDVVPVVEYYIDTEFPKYKDINLVYKEKTLISYFVHTFCEIHNLSKHNIKVNTQSSMDYTGNGDKLAELNLPLQGMEEGLKKYR
jgi:UDP-glucose 4-epimerase